MRISVCASVCVSVCVCVCVCECVCVCNLLTCVCFNTSVFVVVFEVTYLTESLPKSISTDLHNRSGDTVLYWLHVHVHVLAAEGTFLSVLYLYRSNDHTILYNLSRRDTISSTNLFLAITLCLLYHAISGVLLL